AAAQILRRGTIEPKTLDPQRASYLSEEIILQDLYESLVVLSPTGELVGGAAESWTISADGTVYTFRLRPGLRWSNGDPLSASDFVRGIRRLVDSRAACPNASLASPIGNADEIRSGRRRPEELGVAAVGATTVRIVLAAATPYFLTALTNASFVPLHARSGAEPRRAIGNGAYVLAEWTPGRRIVLERNRAYWDAAHVRIAEVQYLPMPDV